MGRPPVCRHIFNSGSSRSRRYAERLIGSIPREGDEHIIVPGPTISSLRAASYMQYYNEVRTDLSWDKGAPALRSESRTTFFACPILGGLHHQYVRI
jgi:hypothetical protein